MASWAESSDASAAFLPPLEVLLQDMQKLDEIEQNFVPHPDVGEAMLLGNIWKTNLLGAWVAKFMAGFTGGRSYEFESTEPTGRAAVVSALVKVFPDVWDDDTLWAMSQRLETSAQM